MHCHSWRLVSTLLASAALFLTPPVATAAELGLDELPYVPYVSTPEAVV